MSTPGLQDLNRDECVELIESTPIGRVGFWADGAPLVLPVNFRWHENSVVFRTLEGQKLDAAAISQPVCFEVDRWDDRNHDGWSVVVRGVAEHVSEWADVEQLEQLGLIPWAGDEWRSRWVRIVPTEISGRWLHGSNVESP
jgi:nitroimidazol reductase NimA-like FMN-containing flavoprotein (pyridoxamine 5'-phosphate oxidase superfamily)